MTTFQEIAEQIGKLVTEKNQAYGSSFKTSAVALRLLYPDGIQPKSYRDALLLVRVWDKMMRIATDKDALGESPWRDIAGYGILGASTDVDRRTEAKKQTESFIPACTSIYPDGKEKRACIGMKGHTGPHAAANGVKWNDGLVIESPKCWVETHDHWVHYGQPMDKRECEQRHAKYCFARKPNENQFCDEPKAHLGPHRAAIGEVWEAS